MTTAITCTMMQAYLSLSLPHPNTQSVSIKMEGGRTVSEAGHRFVSPLKDRFTVCLPRSFFSCLPSRPRDTAL